LVSSTARELGERDEAVKDQNSSYVERTVETAPKEHEDREDQVEKTQRRLKRKLVLRTEIGSRKGEV
jgi:hypothetical protein